MGDGIVTFKISPDGQVTEIDADGFVGSGCMDFAKRTIAALGHVQSEKKKDSYYAHQGSGIKVGA